MSDDKPEDFGAQLRRMMTASKRASAEAAALYDALRATKRLREVAVSEYRCGRGCLLLHIYQTPRGLAFHMPRYRLSPALNEQRSNASGRAKNTEDGDHKWSRSDGLIDDAANFGVNCDHVTSRVVEMEALAMGAPGSPARTII